MSKNSHIEQNPMIGIAFALAGTVLFSMGDSIGKWLTADYPVMQIAWIRSCSGLLLIGSFALFTGRLQQLKTSHPRDHVIRSFMSAGTIIFIFYALKSIPVAEYVSLTFAAPFLIALFSPMVLQEKVSLHSWMAIGVGFIGILFVMRPTPDHFHIAHLASLSVAASIAALTLTARLMAKTESAVALNFYIYPANIFISAWWALDGWVAPSLHDWILFLLLGVSATSALGCFIQALRYAKPSVVAPIDYARMLWMVGLGYLVWGEVPETMTWIGIAIIVASGIYVVSHGKKTPELEVSKETNTGL
ncbi:MAG: EamA family transporter [Gammaproteobacteria bacterium]|nr:EamA family transporter [Gammaproteobacteria bacterium]